MELLAGEQTPLHIAVCLGLMPLVERAVSRSTKETNSDLSPPYQATKFMSRAYKNLTARGKPSPLIAPDEHGNTPLHEETTSSRSFILRGQGKQLATRNRSARSNEINKRNSLGNTPLHLAFQFDHSEIVEFLVKNGADGSIKNNAQVTALELGARFERGDILGILKRDEEMRDEFREETKKVMEDLVRGPLEVIVEEDEEDEEETIEEPVEEPVEELVVEPVAESRGEPVKETVQKPIAGSVEEAVVETVEQAVEDPVEETGEDVVEEPAGEPFEEPTGKPAEETLKELTGELVEQTVEEPVGEPVEELADGTPGEFWSGMADPQASRASPRAALEAFLEAPLQAFPRAPPQASLEAPLSAPQVPPWGKVDIRYCARCPPYMGLDWLIEN